MIIFRKVLDVKKVRRANLMSNIENSPRTHVSATAEHAWSTVAAIAPAGHPPLRVLSTQEEQETAQQLNAVGGRQRAPTVSDASRGRGRARRSCNIPCSNSLFRLCSNRTVNVLNLTARRFHAGLAASVITGAPDKRRRGDPSRARTASAHRPRSTGLSTSRRCQEQQGSWAGTEQKHPVRFYPASQPNRPDSRPCFVRCRIIIS